MKTSNRIGAALAVSALLLAPSAFAAGGKDTSVKGDRGGAETGGGGSDIGGGASYSGGETSDRILGTGGVQKKWEIAASAEYHHLLVQNYQLDGVGDDKNFLYYQAYGKWLPTKNDEVALYLGVYQRVLADPQETGFRLDDLLLRYSRYLPIPSINAQAYGRVGIYFPTSFASHLAGTIGVGRLTLGFEKYWGKYVLTGVRAAGEGYWQQYSTVQGNDPTNPALTGGNPNPAARATAAAEVRVNMPFHTPLFAGVDLYTAYTWYYDVNGTPPPGSPGAPSVDPQFQHQPVQQSYGGEVFVGYDLPPVQGVKSELHAALANGDPALGYTSFLHDGVTHGYVLFRQTSEVYFSLLARY